MRDYTKLLLTAGKRKPLIPTAHHMISTRQFCSICIAVDFNTSTTKLWPIYACRDQAKQWPQTSFPNCWYQLTLKLSLQMEINCNRDYENADTLKSTAILSCEVMSSCSSDLKGESGKRVKIAFLNRSVPLLWANLFFAIVLLSAEVGNRVVLPLWVDSANGTVTGATMNPYFALSFSSIVFFIIFGLGTMFIRVFSPKDIGDTEERFPHLLLFLVGFCDALNGVLILFACKGSRTPPYLQAILGNFLIPLTVLFRWVRFKYIKKLGFKKHMPRSKAFQTHYENTCQTPLCNSGNPLRQIA